MFWQGHVLVSGHAWGQTIQQPLHQDIVYVRNVAGKSTTATAVPGNLALHGHRRAPQGQPTQRRPAYSQSDVNARTSPSAHNVPNCWVKLHIKVKVGGLNIIQTWRLLTVRLALRKLLHVVLELARGARRKDQWNQQLATFLATSGFKPLLSTLRSGLRSCAVTAAWLQCKDSVCSGQAQLATAQTTRQCGNAAMHTLRTSVASRSCLGHDVLVRPSRCCTGCRLLPDAWARCINTVQIAE